jgi:DeoR family transcriptional regulator, suf operon transcriptional repressor
MKSTRDRILQYLLNHPRSSINDLADTVGINAISVRHHLTSLQADGLVADEEERHGVGRPRLVYSLTEDGLEHFPTRYLRLSDDLLTQIKTSLSVETVEKIFADMAKTRAEELTEKIRSLPLNKKLDFIKSYSSQEGYAMDWEKQDNVYYIYQSNCPYYHIGKDHREVCIFDQTLLSTLLEKPVEMVGCSLQGDAQCVFKFMVKTN